MAGKCDEEIELEEMDNLPDMSHYDYDMEYLVRKRHKDNIDINRQLLNEAKFESGFLPTNRKMSFAKRLISKVMPPEPIKSSLTPPRSCREWWKFFLIRLPILSTIWTYKPSFIAGDIVAGITVAIMHIPQGLAYALLANLPPVYGLYTSVLPPIVYAVFGTSRHISLGTFAVVELMIANTIEKILRADGLAACLGGNSTIEVFADNSSSSVNCEDIKVEIAITLACVVGIIMLLMGIFKLGFITIFLSEPLVSGYTTGAAVVVFTSQLRHIIGVDANVPPGLFRVPKTWIASLQLLGRANPATVVVSVISILILVGFRLINKGLQRIKVPLPVYSRKERKWCVRRYKWPMALPSQLIIVVIGITVSVTALLEQRFGVLVVGDIPIGPPLLTLPSLRYLQSVTIIVDAFVISIVTFSVTVSLAKTFARRYNYTIDSDQELVAYGMMNIGGSFFSSFPAAGSLSRSLIQASSGGKTNFVAIISSLLILVVLLALGFLFEQLPRAVLAAIIWVALYGMFTQVTDLKKFFKLGIWGDMWTWLVVFFATSFLGVDVGLGVGVAFSLIVIIGRIILPTSPLLGRAKNTEIFRNISNFEKITTVPGVLIFRFQAPLCFINSRVFRRRLEILLSLDSSSINKEEPGIVEKIARKTCLKRRNSYSPEEGRGAVTGGGGGGGGRRTKGGFEGDEGEGNSTLKSDTNINRSASFQEAMSRDIVSSEHVGSGSTVTTPIHTVIIDCAPIGFLDSVGVKTLNETVTELDTFGIQVVLCSLIKENRDILERAGFFTSFGKEWLFPSIQDAVYHAKFGDKLHPTGEEPTRLQEATPDSLADPENGTLPESEAESSDGSVPSQASLEANGPQSIHTHVHARDAS